MKTKILGIALFALTLGTVIYYPTLKAKHIDSTPIEHIVAPVGNPKVDVVFVLDTTGSMSGLIQTAKEKICRSQQRWRRHSRLRRFGSVWSHIVTGAIITSPKLSICLTISIPFMRP